MGRPQLGFPRLRILVGNVGAIAIRPDHTRLSMTVPELLVPQEPDHLVQTQAGSRKRRPPQFFEHLSSPVLGGDDEYEIV